MTDTTTACPECDSSQVYERETKTPAWRCNDCGAEFETPVERELRDHSTDADSDDTPEPTVTALDTPDAAFAIAEPGATLDMDTYADPFTLMEVCERTVWDVPFADDWVDAEVIVTKGSGVSGDGYRVDVQSDGSVDLYRPRGDEGVREGEKLITTVDDVEHAGEISRASKLQLVGDGVDMPDGDDSWKRVGGGSA